MLTGEGQTRGQPEPWQLLQGQTGQQWKEEWTHCPLDDLVQPWIETILEILFILWSKKVV